MEGAFKAYDIRGIYNYDIRPDLFYKIGLATAEFTKKNLKWKNIYFVNSIR